MTRTKDPICGMTVDKAKVLHADRAAEAFYFCGEHCQEKVLAAPARASPTRGPAAAVASNKSLN